LHFLTQKTSIFFVCWWFFRLFPGIIGNFRDLDTDSVFLGFGQQGAVPKIFGRFLVLEISGLKHGHAFSEHSTTQFEWWNALKKMTWV